MSTEEERDSASSAASFGVRFGARVIDTLIGFGIGIAGGFLGGLTVALLVQRGAIDRGALARLGGLSVGVFAWSFVGNLAYHVLAESIGGATIGKWICGLRVRTPKLSPDGTLLLGTSRCSLGGALVRSLAFLVDGMFFGAIAYFTMEASPSKQRLGDRWGNTVVVRASTRPEITASPAAGALLGVAAWGVFCVVAILTKVL